ncbi:MAG: hypothetical protein J5746_10965 [Victivallales bacterium]|nr:hypothetical protein [Victivallales bacterium]
MKNPLKMAGKIAGKLFRGVFSRGVLFVLTLLVLLDLYFETVGLPKATVRYAENKINEKIGHCTIDGIRAGVWNGFVAYGVRLVGGEDTVHLDASIQKVQFGLELLDFLRFHIKPKYLLLENCTLNCSGLAAVKSNICISKIRILLQTTLKDTIEGSAYAEWNGIRISLNGRIKGFEDFSSFEKLASIMPASNGDEINPALDNILQNVMSADFGYNDCFLDLSLKMDLDDLKGTSLSGSFSIANTDIAGIFISKLHGNFRLEDNILDVEKLLWLLGRNEMLRGELHYDLNRQLVSCNANATIFPTTAMQLAGLKSQSLGRGLLVRKPLSMKFDMPFCKPDLDAISFSAECQMEETSLGRIDVSGSGFRMHYEKRVLNFNEICLMLSDNGSEMLSGTASFNIADGTLDCVMMGGVCIGRKLDTMGISLPDALRRNLDENTEISLKMEKSPLEPKKMALQCQLLHPSFKLARWNINELRLPIEYKEGRLAIKNGSFALRGNADVTGSINAELDVLSSIEQKVLQIPHCVSLAVPSKDDDGQLLSWNGDFRQELEIGNILCKGKCSAFLDRLYKYCVKEYEPDMAEYCEPFKCGRLPFLGAAEFKAPANGNWTVSCDIKAQEGCGYGTLICREGSAKFNLDAKGLSFKDITATLVNDEKVYLNLGIIFTPFTLDITGLDVTGNPRLAENFIFSTKGRKIYSQVWEGMQWSKDDFPRVRIPKLQYFSDDASISWGLVLENGLIEARNFLWSQENIRAATVKLEMNLPEEVLLPEIKFDLDKMEMKGACQIATAGTPHCSFQVERCNGTLDLRSLLVTMAPELDKALPTFEIGNKTVLDCEGSCNLEKPYQVELDGKIKSNSLSVMHVTAEDIEGNWSYKNNVVRISVGDSKMMNGKFSGGFSYDRNQQCGDFIGQCENMSLERILQAATKDEKATYPGIISANCALRYHLGWGNVPHQLDGVGHISLSKSDIWRVPGLNALGKALDFTNGSIFRNGKTSNLGKISDAEANVNFLGTRLIVTDFKTDGTLVTLQGNGQYLWDQDYVDFTVDSRLLHKINLLSVLFRPLTGSFYAQLKGPRKEAKWKISSFLGKWIGGE